MIYNSKLMITRTQFGKKLQIRYNNEVKNNNMYSSATFKKLNRI
jgi:hypothetical protein